MKKTTIESLIKKEARLNKKKKPYNSFWKSLKKKPKAKENNLTKKLLLAAAIGIFANSPCTHLYEPPEQPKQIIEKNTENNISKLEYKSSLLVQDQINYSKGDAYIQILKNISDMSTSLDSILWDLQITVIKPEFEIKYNKVPDKDRNKIFYSEWWHVNGEIDGDKVTIADLNGDGVPDVLYHDKDSKREIINIDGHIPQILYSNKSLSRETILLNPKININKKNFPYDKKDSSEKNKYLILKACNLFFKSLEYFNKEVYQEKNGNETISFE